MSYQEKMVLAHFVVLTLLWVLRKPLVIPGWGDLFEPGFVTDSTTVIAVTIALFVAHARAPNFGAVGGSGRAPTGGEELGPRLTRRDETSAKRDETSAKTYKTQ